MGSVVHHDCSGHVTALASAYLHRPDAHPLWHGYQVSLVHLRPVEGMPAQLRYPDASHEIVIIALNPNVEVDPGDPKSFGRAYLTPINLSYQLRGSKDEDALHLYTAFLEALSSGEVSPDTDHRSCQIAWLERWESSN